MVKHTQTIRRQIADELFECVWLFCQIGAKRDNQPTTKQRSYNIFVFWTFSRVPSKRFPDQIQQWKHYKKV